MFSNSWLRIKIIFGLTKKDKIIVSDWEWNTVALDEKIWVILNTQFKYLAQKSLPFLAEKKCSGYERSIHCLHAS